MSEGMDQGGVSSELNAINRELSRLLHADPCPFSLGADAALKDELVVCGILGGKDVGKSTLINTLAGTEVSVDSEEVGKGTARPMVYVHEAMQSGAMRRLQEIGQHVPFDVSLHRADSIRTAVLVDMPDFDSDYADHRRIVQRVAPLLDRVLWVQTPRKIGDRAWVELFRDVIKDTGNIQFVLNKVDEMLADGEPFDSSAGDGDSSESRRAEAIREAQDQWFAQSIEAAGAPSFADQRFLISAAFSAAEAFVARIGERWDDPNWSKYAGDRAVVAQFAKLMERDVDRLRACVLAEVSGEQARTIKTANRAREHDVAIARMKEHFDLERTGDRLEQVCDPEYGRQVLDASMGRDYCAAVGSALETQFRSDKQLADELLERRVECWPFLRLVYWPLGWLSRSLSLRRFLPGQPDSRGRRSTAVGRPMDAGGRPMIGRIELIRARVLADHAGVASPLRIEPKLPSAKDLERRAVASVEKLPSKLEATLLDDLRCGDRSPSLLGKAGLWLILLWFPILQPVLEGVLQSYALTHTWDLAHAAYRIVFALSATHLFSGLGVVTGIYVALLAGMYTRALRAVRCLRKGHGLSKRLDEAVDEILVAEVIVPLLEPFQECLDRLKALELRLERSGISENVTGP